MLKEEQLAEELTPILVEMLRKLERIKPKIELDLDDELINKLEQGHFDISKVMKYLLAKPTIKEMLENLLLQQLIRLL
jgi:hypothetical protein